MQEAMLGAEHRVTTHEPFDHLCGLARSSHLDTSAPKARMNAGQLGGAAMMSVADPRLRSLVEPIDLSQGLHRLAPGVVLIAPGHTPGSLWIYVRQASGAEWPR